MQAHVKPLLAYASSLHCVHASKHADLQVTGPDLVPPASAARLASLALKGLSAPQPAGSLWGGAPEASVQVSAARCKRTHHEHSGLQHANGRAAVNAVSQLQVACGRLSLYLSTPGRPHPTDTHIPQCALHQVRALAGVLAAHQAQLAADSETAVERCCACHFGPLGLDLIAWHAGGDVGGLACLAAGSGAGLLLPTPAAAGGFHPRGAQ